MRTQVPDYFEETKLTSEPFVQVDDNLSPQVTRMWLREGINVVHTEPNGLQIMAQVANGKIVAYTAFDSHRNPLIVVHGEQKLSDSKSTIMVMDMVGKVLKTYLVPAPRSTH